MAKTKLPIFYIDDFEKPDGKGTPFYINSLSGHIKKNTFLSWPYRHDFYIIIYFTVGFGHIIIDFIEYPIEPGSIFFMSPGQVHSYELIPGSDGTILFFSGELLDGYYSQKRLSVFSFLKENALHLQIEKYSEVEQSIKFILSGMIKEKQNSRIESTELIKDYLDILIIKLLRLLPEENQSTTAKGINWQLREFEKLIDKHFLEHHPPAFYADKIHITTKYLNQLCKKYLVKTTTQIIHERLALEAKRLLTHEHLNSNQVANRLNFEDHSYFTRFFKKVTGSTPGQFKKMYRK
jgi:AraC family transcriptional regulator, transcriptional activator of pobA